MEEHKHGVCGNLEVRKNTKLKKKERERERVSESNLQNIFACLSENV